jgi:S1-C subfamily serine protease
MYIKKILVLLTLLFILVSSKAQQEDKQYFDISGHRTTQQEAYYYRVRDKSPDGYKSWYVSSGKLYFEGQMVIADNGDEAKNQYTGQCIWYYKNGQKKTVRNFDGQYKETGKTVYYHESGKVWKEVEYSNGSMLEGRYTEFTDDGDVIRIFEDDFDNNGTDWDLYKSNASSSEITGGKLNLRSFTNEGTSRYVSIPIQAGNYMIEATFGNSESKGKRIGIVWGFKDWKNYNYLAFSNNYVYVGTVYEGIELAKIDGLYASEINKNGSNTLKLFAEEGKLLISVNGTLLSKTGELKLYGSQLGFIVSGKSAMSVDQLIVKEFTGKNSHITASSDLDVKSSGTGFFISNEGLIATNYHVVENSNQILVDLSLNGETKSYQAIIVQKDEQNDLAILKLKGEDIRTPEILYSFSESTSLSAGNSVFTIGYPYALSGMGTEAKFADGRVSAKTGFNNAINAFQTTIPVQPGNSGSPVFNESGQLIGIINAKFNTADNVSYAIKLNYLKNIFELLSDKPLPTNPSLSSLTLEEKLKVLSKYVVLIKSK